MAKMRAVRRSKDGVTLSLKTGLPKTTAKTATKTATSATAKAPKAARATSYINEDGVKVTMCNPSPAPKVITGRGYSS